MGYDMSEPNERPGECAKCRGSGLYLWGTYVNGKMTNSGQCHSCRGKGRQTWADIHRNNSYNRHKLANLDLASMM